jgi:hypothetical protein
MTKVISNSKATSRLIAVKVKQNSKTLFVIFISAQQAALFVCQQTADFRSRE